MNYQGDFLEDATVYIPFNTFDSNDPSASVTITNLAQGDVEVWKDGVVQTTAGSGVSLTLNIGTNNGTHLIAVDTSNTTDGGFYVINADYQVRINGTTVDGATINAWVGTFSIENRFTEVNVTAISGDTTAADNLEAVLDGNGITADVDLTARSVTITHDAGVGLAVTGTTDAIVATGTAGSGIKSISSGSNGHGLELAGNGTGEGLSATGGATGEGIEAIGGASGGAGIRAAAQANNDAGMELVKHGTGDDLDADDLADITTARMGALTDWINGGRLDLILDIIATDTTTDIPALIATAQADLDTITGGSGVFIDTDAVDADALKTDAVDEIWAKAMSDLATGAPSATASVFTAINIIYEAFRNRTLTTATLITIMKDDGSTALMKSTISDDATTFVKGEFISGA